MTNTRLQRIEFTSTLVTETCCNCGVLFAMPEDLRDECFRAKEKRFFYCPNGHQQHYIGKSDTELRKEAERAAASAAEEARIARIEADRAKREAAALRREKAAATRRAKAALCPVPECKRSIVQLRRHLETKHAEYAFTPEQLAELAQAQITATRRAEVLARAHAARHGED